MPQLDLDLVRHALTVARRNGYREVELGIGSDHFHAKMEPKPPAVAPSEAGAPSEPAVKAIQSNAVGYYSPGAKALAPGVKIEKGDHIAAIEVLGLANDLEAKFGGMVVEILVEPGDPVEYGQVLAMVLPE